MSVKSFYPWRNPSAIVHPCDSGEGVRGSIFSAKAYLETTGRERCGDWSCVRTLKASDLEKHYKWAEREYNTFLFDDYSAIISLKGSSLSRLGEVGLEPDRLDELLSQAESILSLPDDWDGEGALPVARAAWDRAVALLDKSIRVPVRRGLILPLPAIDPGPNGSIDLEWYKDDQCLLINVPSSMSDPVTYYGRRKDCGDGRGALCEDVDNAQLIAWMLGVGE